MDISNEVVDIIIKNDKNQVLLVKRASTVLHCPSCWSFPGGKVDANENRETALRRELKEELNVAITEMHFFRDYHYALDKDTEVHAFYYAGNIKGIPKIKKNEISEFKWFDIKKELLNLNWAFNQRNVMEDFLAVQNQIE
ncbi:NUDIX hydrolase [Candidatus Woesearchaeota archaeon]|nr:NUDIX hydrolase [Candidatus Woesearchaeota archaeon]